MFIKSRSLSLLPVPSPDGKWVVFSLVEPAYENWSVLQRMPVYAWLKKYVDASSTQEAQTAQ